MFSSLQVKKSTSSLVPSSFTQIHELVSRPAKSMVDLLTSIYFFLQQQALFLDVESFDGLFQAQTVDLLVRKGFLVARTRELVLQIVNSIPGVDKHAMGLVLTSLEKVSIENLEEVPVNACEETSTHMQLVLGCHSQSKPSLAQAMHGLASALLVKQCQEGDAMLVSDQERIKLHLVCSQGEVSQGVPLLLDHPSYYILEHPLESLNVFVVGPLESTSFQVAYKHNQPVVGCGLLDSEVVYTCEMVSVSVCGCTLQSQTVFVSLSFFSPSPLASPPSLTPTSQVDRTNASLDLYQGLNAMIVVLLTCLVALLMGMLSERTFRRSKRRKEALEQVHNRVLLRSMFGVWRRFGESKHHLVYASQVLELDSSSSLSMYESICVFSVWLPLMSAHSKWTLLVFQLVVELLGVMGLSTAVLLGTIAHPVVVGLVASVLYTPVLLLMVFMREDDELPSVFPSSVDLEADSLFEYPSEVTEEVSSQHHDPPLRSEEDLDLFLQDMKCLVEKEIGVDSSPPESPLREAHPSPLIERVEARVRKPIGWNLMDAIREEEEGAGEETEDLSEDFSKEIVVSPASPPLSLASVLFYAVFSSVAVAGSVLAVSFNATQAGRGLFFSWVLGWVLGEVWMVVIVVPCVSVVYMWVKPKSRRFSRMYEFEHETETEVLSVMAELVLHDKEVCICVFEIWFSYF